MEAGARRGADAGSTGAWVGRRFARRGGGTRGGASVSREGGVAASEVVDVDEAGIARALRARGLTLGERVDQGAFAVVYKATSAGGGDGDDAWRGGAGTVHAVKVLSAAANTVSTRRDFEREAKLLTRVSHPGIVKAHFYDDSPQPYMVTEFCTSGNLWNALRAKEVKASRFDGGEVAMIPDDMPLLDFPTLVRDIADALTYLHTAGFAHRDIKTSNILLTWSDELGRIQAKLCDFGSAAPVSKMPRRPKRGTIERALGLGKGWQPVGTMLWMAPEMLSPPMVGEDLAGFGGDKSDVYALGVVMWECLEWRIPWMNEGSPTRARIIEEVVDNGSRLIPKETTSIALKALLKSMFETIPADRPSAARVSQTLESMMRRWDSTGSFDHVCRLASTRGREVAALLEGSSVEKDTQNVIEEEARAVAGDAEKAKPESTSESSTESSSESLAESSDAWPAMLVESASFAQKEAEVDKVAVADKNAPTSSERDRKAGELLLTRTEENRIRLTDIDPESWLGEPGTLDADMLGKNVVNMIFPHILNAEYTPEMAQSMVADIEALQELTKKFNDLKRRSRTDPFAALAVDAKGREVKRMTKKIERTEVEAQLAAWDKVRTILREELKRSDDEISSWRKELRRL